MIKKTISTQSLISTLIIKCLVNKLKTVQGKRQGLAFLLESCTFTFFVSVLNGRGSQQGIFSVLPAGPVIMFS